MPTLIARNLKTLKKALSSQRFKNKKNGLVPTMGSIHKGHLALVNKSIKLCETTIVTIFVNPIQFNNREDLKNYPTAIGNDIEILTQKKVDLIFIPNIRDMYPQDFSTYINLNKFSDILCGKKRKGHFSGVATVVMKLLSLIQPQCAFFGEKDYQQLIIIKKLVKDFNLNVKIYPVKTVRDKNGLALSSRNKLLNKEQKIKASKINTILNKITLKSFNGKKKPLHLIKKNLNLNGIYKIEYLEIRDEKFLELFTSKGRNINNYRIFIAVKIGKVRLIDNVRLLAK